VHKRIESVYNDVANVDPWVGVLAEPNVSDSMLGETGTTILRDQFAALRDGDRFFYADNLQEELVEYVDRQTLARIIRRKTDIGDELQENVFTVGETDMSPRVSQMRMRTSTGDAELRWNSVPAERYRVRSSRDLLNWIDVDPDCKSEGWSTELLVPGDASNEPDPRLQFFAIEPRP